MIPEGIKVVQALYPQTNGGALTGDYISLKYVKELYIVVNVQQGNAATIALTIEQATAVAGTNTKAITVAVPIWYNLDTATNDTLTRDTDAVSKTTDAGVKNKVYIFKVDPATLDLANGFDCITVKAGASNAANLVGAVYLCNMRYKGSTLSLITD